MQVEEAIEAEGAGIVWVLEANGLGAPGTAAMCADFMQGRGSDRGWCVGDGQTEPEAGVFDASPFSIGRGFDILVHRADMRIDFSTSHGTPSGNENLDGDDVLALVREALAR